MNREPGVGGMDGRDDVKREIRHHIEERVDRLVEEGWEPHAARQEAERRFGDRERYGRELRRIDRGRRFREGVRTVLASAVGDVRYALRGMRRRAGFSVGVILTLALGIGAAAAIFTYADALLLRPLPYRDADRLVTVNTVLGSNTLPFVASDQIEPWEEEADFLAPFALYELEGVVRTDGPDPERLTTLFVSHDLDDVLGVEPALGRAFTDSDARAGDRALLTYGYWRRTGMDPGVVGTTLRLNERVVTVVGVLPRDFKFPVAASGDLAAWLVLGPDHSAAGTTLSRMSVLARLPEGMAVETAQARMDELAEGLAEEREARFGWTVRLSHVGEWRANPEMVRGVRLLAGAVALMLLVALTNAVNLLLFRAVERERELAVRLALGGSRRRLLRQLLVESLVLGLAAGAGAALLAWGAVQGLAPFLPQEFHFSSVYEFRIEGRALAFTFLVSVLVGTVLGLAPGWMIVYRRLGRSSALRPALVTHLQNRFQELLVAAEVALSVALLMGCGLLVNSFVRLVSTDTGFDDERIAVLEVELPEHRYPTPETRGDFHRRLEAELEALPGVAGVTVAEGVPPRAGFSFGYTLQAENGRALGSETPGGDLLLMPRPSVRPDYVSTLGLRLRAGRNLADEDVGTGNVIVNETLARDLWGSAGAVGRRFRTSEEGDWLEVVGVVDDVVFMGLDGRQAPWAILDARAAGRASPYMHLAVRARRAPAELLPSIRRTVHGLDPDLPITLAPVRDALVETVEKPRFLSTLMLGLAATALALAGVGLYGVLSYAVSRRRREIGIRVSLGAEPRRVRRMVLAGGLKLAVLGIAAGLAGGLALSRLVRGLLYGVEPTDPLTLATVCALMIATAAAASWLPARRATRVDPVKVLRAE